MKHEVTNFDHLIGQVDGLSEAQLKAHFGLYTGYVNKLNEIEEKLAKADPAQSNYSFGEFSELKRREAVAFNGSYLHQLYFENLAPNRGQISAALKGAIDADFGSYQALEANMKGAAVSTPGWVLLTQNRIDKKLHSYIMYEHHIGLPVHQEILLALDCWEHAFMIDYGTKKPDYLATFFKNVNWNVVNERYAKLKG